MTKKEKIAFKSRQIFLIEVSKAANAKVVISPPMGCDLDNWIFIDTKRDLVNHIRHKRTNYEAIGYNFSDHAPRDIWKRRVLQAIAAKFPHLADECRAQIRKI